MVAIIKTLNGKYKILINDGYQVFIDNTWGNQRGYETFARAKKEIKKYGLNLRPNKAIKEKKGISNYDVRGR